MQCNSLVVHPPDHLLLFSHMGSFKRYPQSWYSGECPQPFWIISGAYLEFCGSLKPFQTWAPWRGGAGLSPEFAFHTWTTQWEILHPDTFSITTINSPEDAGEGGKQQAETAWDSFFCSQHIDTELQLLSPQTLLTSLSVSGMAPLFHPEIFESFFQFAR